MRVTNSMLANTILRNISATYERISKGQDRLSSGKLYNLPSDNPVAMSQGLNLRSVMKGVDQHLSNIEDGLSWLKTADTSLMSATDILQRAKELAVQGANGTNTQNSLDAIAKEVDQMISDMVSIGNTTFDGRYIFSGNKTTTAPFTYNPGAAGPPVVPSTVTYNGDAGNISYEIEKGVNIPVNLTGDVVFNHTAVADPNSVFNILITLREDLKAGNFAAISNDTDEVDKAITTISNSSMTVGAKIRRFESTKDRLSQDKLNLTEILSNLEDADMAEVITRLKMEENVYQAGLAAGSTAIQKSLMDFLR